MIPCNDDPSFISDRNAVRNAAALTCLTCPVFDECAELGRGEDFGTYAGTTELHPDRALFRRENRAAFLAGHTCRNGHDLGTEDEPSENRVPLPASHLPFETNLPRVGCLRCTHLRDLIDLERRAGAPDHADLIGA